MHGGIEKLRIFSSYYAESKRKEITYEVCLSRSCIYDISHLLILGFEASGYWILTEYAK